MGVMLVATEDSLVYDTYLAELSGDGHEVLWAVNGQEAYDMALEHKPDIIFIDTPLSVFNSLALCDLIYDDPELPAHQPIFLITDDDVNPRIVEKHHITGVFPQTHVVNDLRELVVAHLKPEAMP